MDFAISKIPPILEEFMSFYMALKYGSLIY